jgi:hypothetical protein
MKRFCAVASNLVLLEVSAGHGAFPQKQSGILRLSSPNSRASSSHEESTVSPKDL